MSLSKRSMANFHMKGKFKDNGVYFPLYPNRTQPVDGLIASGFIEIEKEMWP